MHAAFGTVLWIVCGVGAIIAVVALLVSGRTWSELGRGGLVMDRDKSPAATPASERDDEIRALLAARNARRARRGEQPVDVEAELARLTTPAPDIDPELAEEVRQLVVARNARRTRAGKPALDVEAEVARELRRVSEGFG